MFKKFFKRSRNQPPYGYYLSLPEDLRMLTGAAPMTWMINTVGKRRHFASDGRVGLSLEQTGTNLLIAQAWLLGGAMLGGRHPEKPFTHQKIERVSFPWHPPQIIEPTVSLSMNENDIFRLQSVSSRYAIGWRIPESHLSIARARAEQLGDDVRDSVKRCPSCRFEYDTAFSVGKEEAWEWGRKWGQTEVYSISWDGDVLRAVDSGLNGSVLMSAAMSEGEFLRIAWSVGIPTLTQQESLMEAVRLSQNLTQTQPIL